MDGWVVVGTKELSEPNDISDDITWREFCREYFQDTDALIEEVNGADNGEWLKVIDNDGDGVADYIFRIDFAMSVIERISKDTSTLWPLWMTTTTRSPSRIPRSTAATLPPRTSWPRAMWFCTPTSTACTT